MERLITELTLNLFDHEEGACLHVLAHLLQNKEEQLETVSRKVWTRAWISRRVNVFILLRFKNSLPLLHLTNYIITLP